jgi:hypothetical protein
MPISDYANAFFLVHRRRVTFETAVHPIAVLFFRRCIPQHANWASLSVKAPAFATGGSPQKHGEIFARRKIPRKKQKPGNAGLLQSWLSAGLFRQLGDLMRQP